MGAILEGSGVGLIVGKGEGNCGCVVPTEGGGVGG